jgi:hypothetical protein
MAIVTQFSRDTTLNDRLTKAGASRTVYALVTPETEAAKAKILGSSGPEIERHMCDFQMTALTSDWNSWNSALQRHSDWLLAVAYKDPIDHIPFRQEAELFAGFYWANKERHQAAMQVQVQPNKNQLCEA